MNRRWKPSSFFLHRDHPVLEVTVDKRGLDAADYVAENAHFNQILRRFRIEDERRMRSMDIDAQDIDRYSITRCE